eukprot:755242-Hanusia_phi.AAC.2
MEVTRQRMQKALRTGITRTKSGRRRGRLVRRREAGEGQGGGRRRRRRSGRREEGEEEVREEGGRGGGGQGGGRKGRKRSERSIERVTRGRERVDERPQGFQHPNQSVRQGRQMKRSRSGKGGREGGEGERVVKDTGDLNRRTILNTRTSRRTLIAGICSKTTEATARKTTTKSAAGVREGAEGRRVSRPKTFQPSRKKTQNQCPKRFKASSLLPGQEEEEKGGGGAMMMNRRQEEEAGEGAGRRRSR